MASNKIDLIKEFAEKADEDTLDFFLRILDGFYACEKRQEPRRLIYKNTTTIDIYHDETDLEIFSDYDDAEEITRH